ncbi:MAG: ribonuclease [Clostridia bacterium]|nr:ribonuclease [Clostridia bacterium]
MNYRGTIEFDAGCVLVAYVSVNPTEPQETEPETTWNNDSRDYVASYIHTHGCLPSFYVTKSQASSLYGWSGGSLDQYAPGMCIGGDRFGNYEGQLPDAPGRYWTECDIGTIGSTSRGSRRIVFSNDGLIYYTGDHYETFTLLYGEP